MLQGVLDAAERLAAVGLPPGSRVRAFFLKAPHSFSEVAANSVASRDNSALGLQGHGAHVCDEGLFALETSVFWWTRLTARLCRPAGWPAGRTASSLLKLNPCRPAGGSSCTKYWLQSTEGLCRRCRRRQRGLGGRRKDEATSAMLGLGVLNVHLASGNVGLRVLC